MRAIRWFFGRSAIAFALRFLIVAACLATVSDLFLDSVTMAPVVDGWNLINASVANSVSNLIGVNSVRHGTTIISKGFAMEVASGCNALASYVLLAATLIAYPSQWSFKAVGCLVGALLIMVINFARLISLNLAGDRDPALFYELHEYVWPVILIVSSIMFLIAWAHTGSVRVGYLSHAGSRSSGGSPESGAPPQ